MISRILITFSFLFTLHINAQNIAVVDVQKVFDGYYNVLDKDIMKVNDGLFNQELDQKKEKKSKSITSETEEQLKTLLRLKEMGTLPEDIWKEKVKQLIS